MRSDHADGLNRSSVTHGIDTVTDIPDQPYDLHIYRCADVPLKASLSLSVISIQYSKREFCEFYYCNGTILHTGCT